MGSEFNFIFIEMLEIFFKENQMEFTGKNVRIDIRTNFLGRNTLYDSTECNRIRP